MISIKFNGKWPTDIGPDINNILETIIVIFVNLAILIAHLGTWIYVKVIFPLWWIEVVLKIWIDRKLDKALLDGVEAKILFYMQSLPSFKWHSTSCFIHKISLLSFWELRDINFLIWHHAE